MIQLFLILVISTFFVGFDLSALQLKYVGQFAVESHFTFKNTRFGGISGLFYDQKDERIYAISDDRGTVNEPRYYKIKINFGENRKNQLNGKFTLKIEDVIFFTEKKAKDKTHAQLKLDVLDLEGIVKLPNGNVLVSSEGDLNQIPRVLPRLIEYKNNGDFVKDWTLPAEFLPNLTGKQFTGIQNNKGFEGLSLFELKLEKIKVKQEGFRVALACERPLYKERDTKSQYSRILIYDNDKFSLQYLYPLEVTGKEKSIQNGISEILFLDENNLLVLERGLLVGYLPLQYKTDLFQVNLNDFKSEKVDKIYQNKKVNGILNKKLILSFENLTQESVIAENYEGAAIIQNEQNKRFLMLVSDNNFMSDHKTYFVLFKII